MYHNPRPALVLLLVFLLVLLAPVEAKKSKKHDDKTSTTATSGLAEESTTPTSSVVDQREVTIQQVLGPPENGGHGKQQDDKDLEAAAASNVDSTTSVETPNSHKIVVSGWPSTSPMWPSIETAEQIQDPSQSFNWPEMIEPFIFADKPRAIDYSLLLSINKTISDSLKNHQKAIAVVLSFEFYFNYDAKQTTALPGIKIEIDRKQFKYLEPTVNSISPKMWIKFNEQILVTDPQQFDNHDWLKFSLVNRQSPSLVAIRKLKVQFTPNDDGGGGPSGATPPAPNASTSKKQPAPPVQQNEIPMGGGGQQPVGPPPLQQPVQPLAPDVAINPTQIYQDIPQAPQAQPLPAQPLPAQPLPAQPLPPQPLPPQPLPPQPLPPQPLPPQPQQQLPLPVQQQPPIQDQQAAVSTRFTKKIKPQKHSPAGDEMDQVASASDALVSTIRPVKPKTTGSWLPTLGIGNPFGKRRRRKRQVSPEAPQQQVPAQVQAPQAIIFTCYHKDSCEWRADGSEEIQWSSARMPPSTGDVQNGYYYASSLSLPKSTTPSSELQQQVLTNNLLRLSLNQTEAARIKDQNLDQCIELALYITERARLKLYRLTKAPADAKSNWIKGSQILSWAPTMIMEVRKSIDGGNTTIGVVRSALPKSRLPAMEQGKNGWTYETLCYGDFFTNFKDCGSGNCAFGFEMELDDTLQSQLLAAGGVALNQQVASGNNAMDKNDKLLTSLIPEQVVGISLRNEYSVRPSKAATTTKLQPAKWLKTWQRPEVGPEENWKFYPKLDVVIGNDNVSLLNTYDESHYHLHSDWLLVDEHLEFTGSLAVEFDQNITNGTVAAPVVGVEQNGVQPSSELLTVSGEPRLFGLKLITKLVDFQFNVIHASNSTIEWSVRDNTSLAVFSLDMPITEHIKSARQGQLKDTQHQLSEEVSDEERSLFKIIIELIYDVKLTLNSQPDQYLSSTSAEFKFSFANVSLSDRCHSNPCQTGSCHQNGTGIEDWECKCDDGRHRGRRCEFGRWCEIAHVTPWVAPPSPPPVASGATSGSSSNSQQQQQQQSQQQSQQQQQTASQQVGGRSSIGVRRVNVLTPPKSRAITIDSTSGGSPNTNTGRQAKLLENVGRISGSDYCRRKLGSGSKCTEIDLPLDDNLYTEDERTFSCSCQDDYYLSDDSKCKQAHPCNSIVCPSIGMICDETRPFNRTQPCVCNEKQDWHLDAAKGPNQLDRCIRRQCQDIQRDCGFEAHICLPTLPGEKPICKCGPNFALKINETSGARYCQSTACILPTLNECQQVCVPHNEDRQRAYRCDCYPGYTRDPEDERKCRPLRPEPHCRPACASDTQICTDFGCRCKQGYLGEGEVIVKHVNKHPRGAAQNMTTIDYVQSVRCLNVCSLSYAENKREFEMIESVCPLGLCDPSTFQCRCSDPSSSALVNTKYEPIYELKLNPADQLASGNSSDATALATRRRISPLCHLRRVCEPDSISYKICRSQGAICVPDYTRAAMFDCICPPSTEKRFYGQGSSSEFTCEPKCSSVKYECLRRQAICRLVDKDSVRCDCLPGHMFDQHDHKCYLAKYSYSFNLLLVNRYYEPESKFHKLVAGDQLNSTSPSANDETPRLYEPTNSNQNLQGPDLSEVVPQFHQLNHMMTTSMTTVNANSHSAAQLSVRTKSKFIVDYNQCNITHVIPKQIIEDPYEHDIESYLSYIDQCNEKIHQNMRTYHLNSKLAEDLRQSLRQHLRGFTVTTSNNTCSELDSTGMYLNCTVYLQSQEPIQAETVDLVFNNCDKNGQDERFCWIKPRLLLKKNQVGGGGQMVKHQQLNFKQVIPCEIDNFCGPDAFSVRLDEHSSLCSCKCPADIEVVDVKDLERKLRNPSSSDMAAHEMGKLNPNIDYHLVAAKEICAPRNHCGGNSTFCLGKTGSVCHYDIRLGSKCQCVYPSYENDEGKCVEVTFSKLDDTLIILIIMLGTGLVVSIAINLFALAKSQRLFSHSKQYPLNEFPTTNSSQIHQRNERSNQSTGVPNLGFDEQ